MSVVAIKALAQLQRAKQRIVRRGLARDAYQADNGAVCAMGAFGANVYRACSGTHGLAVCLLATAVEADWTVPDGTIACFNDKSTEQQVLAKFDEAIRYAESLAYDGMRVRR